MWIHTDKHAGILRTAFFTPYPAHAQKEPLLWGVTIDFLRGLAAGIGSDSFAQRGQRDARAAVVGGIFAQRQFAIEFQIVHRDKVAILAGDAAGTLLKFLSILCRPPVAQIAGRIEFAPLIVEAVRQLVTNDVADAPKVDGIVHGLVEEWRLQNAGGKHNLIARAVVI